VRAAAGALTAQNAGSIIKKPRELARLSRRA
jgi:hypothetical protein